MQAPVLTLLSLCIPGFFALEALALWVGASGWLTSPGFYLPCQELMEAVHLHLVKEYIIRLSKRRLVLKTEEQQQQLARHILANADVIQHFCTQNVSTSHPHPGTPEWPCSLPKPGQLLLS